MYPRHLLAIFVQAACVLVLLRFFIEGFGPFCNRQWGEQKAIHRPTSKSRIELKREMLRSADFQRSEF